jgi:uncharacterized protein YjbI with pentapeptide repeats
MWPRPVERKKHSFKQEPSLLDGSKYSPWWKRLWGWTEFGKKSGWEYLEILSALAIPIVLAAAGFWFTKQQDQRQQQIENQRAQREQKIENQRAQAERTIQQQNAQDAALQAYLDQMNTLFLEEDLSDAKVQTLLRARTLTVLERLDPSRKTQVMQFLSEAELVTNVDGREPIIALDGASMSNADLSFLDLRGALMTGANLSDADLSDANLSNALLGMANLSDANLSDANLSDAMLINADLSGANLSGATPINADLSDADLRSANLKNAYLSDANLNDAVLSNAVLSNADLSYAEVTQEQLDQARLLEAATMPDGQLHAGEYVTDEFEPALSFSISDSWQLYQDTRNVLDLDRLEEGDQFFTFTSPLHVFDPSKPSELKEVPGPENADEWASWFQRHPNLDTSEPVRVSVGGATGVRIDVTSTSIPENYPRDYCGAAPCVPLFPDIVSYSEWPDRFVIVDVEGETVVIDVSAPADEFDEFAPVAQKVLDTVEWDSR